MIINIKTKPFVEWLDQFIEDDNAIGDLARDMKKSHDLPETNKKVDFEWHLTKYNACIDAVSTLDDAWIEYEDYVNMMNIQSSIKNN